jgi:TP901 family phage tail tape measure protein
VSDFQVKVGGDFSELLNAFKQLPTQAQAAGTAVGKSLGDGVRTAGTSVADLQAQIRALKSSQLKLSADSSEYKQADATIKALSAQIKEISSRAVKIDADSSSINGLRARLGELRTELDKTQIGSQRFKELQGEVRKVESELNKATSASGGFQGTIQKLGPALAAIGLAGFGVTQALRGVVQGAAQFDQEVRKAAAIEGGQQFDSLRKSIEDVASVAAGTPTQVAELATALSRAGFSADETKAALGGIVTGAEATAVSFSDMGSIVADSLRSFGLEASKTGDVVDTLVNAANSSNQTVLDLGESFKFAAPVARNLGIGVDDLAATLALLANNGIRGSEAGTALRTGLTRLQIAAGGSNEELLGLTRGSQILSNAMRKLGADVLDTNGNLKPMDEVILSLRENINQFDTTKRAEIVKALFGDEQGSKFLALLNNTEDDIKDLFGEIRNSSGVAANTRKEMQSFALSFEVLRGNVQNVTNAIGGAFLAVLKPLVDGLNLAISATQALPKPIRDLGAALAAAGVAAGGTAIAIGAFKLALAGVSVQGVVTAITGLVTAIQVNLAGAATVAVVAVQKVGAALIALSTANVGAAIGPLVAALKVNLAGAASVAASAVSALTTAITSGGLLAGLKAFAASAAAAAVALGPLLLAIGGVLALVKTWEFVLGGQAEASKQFEASNKAISEALTKLGVDLDKTAEKAKNAQSGFLGLGEIFRNAREGWTLLRLVDETEKLEQGFDEVFNSAVTFFNELKNSEKITDEQRKKAQEYIAELQKVADAYRQQSERAKQLAVEQARLGNQDLAKFYEAQANSLASNASALDNLRLGTEKQIGVESNLKTAVEQTKEAQDRVADAIKARAEAELELNKIISEAPVRALDAQVAVGQQLIGLSKALADQEQSRFAVIKAALDFELSKAQERGASEQEIAEIKSRIQEQDRQALEARYQALTQQQELETKLLELAQQKARTEADLSVFEARKALLQAEVELKKLSADASTEERSKAEAIVELQRAALGVNEERVNLLTQTQPLEQQVLKAQQETARNAEKAKAEQAGFNIEVDGSVTKTAALSEVSRKVKDEIEARKKVEQEIGEVIKQSSLRLATEQLSVAEKLLGLSRALATEEQSRFDLVRSNLEYELKKAEERGASESEIGSIKERIQQVDRAAAEARYAALLQQQQLEAKMLEIAQRKQVLEANVEFRKQQLALLEAQKKLQEAIAAGDQGAIALARSQVGLQQVMLGVRGEQLGLLAQTQPLEAQILAAQQQAAINAERAKAAQNGYQLAAAGSAVNLQNVANISAGLVTQQGRYTESVANSRIETQRLADGSVVLVQRQNESIKAVGQLDAAYEAANRGAGTAASEAQKLQGYLANSSDPANGIAAAFVKTGEAAPAAEQGARNFAGWLASAAGYADNIAGLQLDSLMNTVARSTALAAGAAKVFYEWLERASRLPGSRWTGGPVEAGEQYKINELGQEALLSGGRLSLINAAPNSLWRAPTNGTVIPAGITARLQEQGALPSRPGAAPIMTSGSSNAALAVEVGKLRQEVGELARKQWNVNVAMKTGPTGSQVIRQMMR